MWPSVLDNDAGKIDHRTTHQAHTVVKGLKYAANAWIHLFDYEWSNHWGCTGSFE